MEAMILKWIRGVARCNHIGNEGIRDRYAIVPILEKLREKHLRSCGHVIRTNEKVDGR